MEKLQYNQSKGGREERELNSRSRRRGERASSMPPTSRALSAYQYRPLSDGCIRLLQLMPHQDESAPIQCRLVDYPLIDSDSGKGCHLYEALSYVWGSPEKPRLVYIETGYIAITENLSAALFRLRDRSFPRVIWADAICINQDDERERSCQVQLMAMIYAKASRVVVWLEEQPARTCQLHREITGDGDKALELIRVAAEGRAIRPPEIKTGHEAILTLFQRSWFRRIWVLQEVSAARQVIIMTHSTEIDGYAFCSGLKALNFASDLSIPSRIQSVVYLIRGAISRRRYSFSNKISLNICPLGQLIDMSQNREATDHRDLVYALLGMSSDNYSAGGLFVNYEIPWKVLFQQVVKYLVSPEAYIGIFAEEKVAVIKTKGFVVGKILEVSSRYTWNDRQIIKVSLNRPSFRELEWRRYVSSWDIQPTAKLIQKGDVVCVLQGVSGFAIIRPYEDYCAIIAIKTTPIPIDGSTEKLEKLLLDLPPSLASNLFLVWEWEKPWDGLDNSWNYESFIQNRASKNTDAKTDDPFDKAARLHIVGIILEKVKQYDQASQAFRKAIRAYEKKSKRDYSSAPTYINGLSNKYQETVRLRLIASIFGSEFDSLSITEDDIHQIANSFDRELMQFLLDRRGSEIQITDSVLEAAARNRYFSSEMIRLLLDRCGDQLIVTEGVFVAAATHLYRGNTLIRLLLDRRGDQITITERLLKAVSEGGAPNSVLKFLGELSGLSTDSYLKYMSNKAVRTRGDYIR
ncbi:heterokaryon incompatibility protein-domain-containing protein [Xylaria scruposa]|nr:heterokaryon incompatibility protein-domain-containing protein [Xylaria scruposa]